MTLSFLFFNALAACLLWTAGSTAAGVRCHRPWLRRLLIVLGLLAPLLALLPWLAGTGVLAFIARLEVNWFAPALTLFLSALIGGGWIMKAGTQPRGGGWSTVPAASWPVTGLFGLFLLAKLSTAGLLLSLDAAAASRAGLLKIEAADLMQTNLPPAVPDTVNAAGLYRAAFAVLQDAAAADQSAEALATAGTIDPTSPAVISLLDRHRPTLQLLRAAASRDVCRFSRDWTRPSVDMLIPEIGHFRQSARLLRLAARRAAAEGRAAASLRDTALLSRLGRHAAAEPLLISGLVEIAIDSTAVATLGEILPTLTPADLPLLDEPLLRDFVVVPPSLTRHFYGEESWGLRTFASFAEGRLGTESLGMRPEFAAGQFVSLPSSAASPALLFYRIFLLPHDLTGYRNAMRTQQRLVAQELSYTEKKRAYADLEQRLQKNRPGILSSLILPALSAAMRAEATSQARHRVAQAAVAATRMRLEEGRLPPDLNTLVPRYLPAVPADLFTDGAALKARVKDGGLLIYSVGPNGVDDDGPAPPGVDPPSSNDDLGLRLPIE